jgi:hypothetical protein
MCLEARNAASVVAVRPSTYAVFRDIDITVTCRAVATAVFVALVLAASVIKVGARFSRRHVIALKSFRVTSNQPRVVVLP